MRAVVTGGSGYFGNVLCAALVAGGHEVVNLDISPVELPGVHFEGCDIRDRIGVRDVFEGADVVFHNVAQVPLARDPDLFDSVNREGTAAMLWAAEQYGEQDSKGSLEVGKLADLVILDKDPLKVEPNDIKDIRVVETIKEGRTIYPASAAQPEPSAVALKDPDRIYAWTSHVCDMSGVNTAAGREWTLTALNGEKVHVAKPPTITVAMTRMVMSPLEPNSEEK